MPLPETLSFATEDERIALMESHAKSSDASPDDFTRIMNALVANPDPAPVEVIDDESFEGSDDVTPIQPAPASAPAPAPAPASAPAPAPAPAPGAPAPAGSAEKPLNRNWTIREDDIPKDTYYDQKSGKVRPYITHTDPKDLLKTVVHEQKRIHYLEDVLIPQEREAAAQQARAAVMSDFEKLRLENEQLKKMVQAPAPAAPAAPIPAYASAPGAPAPGAPAHAGIVSESAAALQAAMSKLQGIDKKDAIEHTDKLMEALVASVNHINNLTTSQSKIQEETGKVTGQFQKIEQDRATEAQRREAETRQSEATQNWQKACMLVDSFAQTNQDFKGEYGAVDQTFGEMTRDAVSFHTYLGSVLFNKHPNQVSNEEQIAASQSYLKGDAKLLQAAQQYGINEPKNYRAWVELDQVDAMRTGMYRDPITKQWVQMSDPITRKPVHLGDMETSYGRYLDVSGKRQEKIQKLLKQQQTGLTDALTRRDKGLVSMDTNSLGSEGGGNEISEQQATDILEQIDPIRAQMHYMKTGSRDMLDRLNQAMVRIGMQPLEVPDVEIHRPGQKKIA